MKLKKAILILAGGKGSRLKGNIIKPLYPLLQEPAIFYVLNSISHLNLDTYVVCSKEVKKYLDINFKEVKTILQNEKGYGTSWAIRCAVKEILNYDRVLILQADDPLITFQFINKIARYFDSSFNVITGKENGRSNNDKLVIEKENLIRISKDGSLDNLGRYIFNCRELTEYVLKQESINGEYPLTDTINKMLNDNITFKIIKEPNLFINMNTIKDVIKVNKVLQKRINKRHITNGVFIENPSLTLIGPKVKILPGTRIEGVCKIIGDSVIEEDCIISNSEISNTNIFKISKIINSYILNSSIGCATKILFSFVEDAIIKEVVEVGPYSHLRSGTIIETKVCVGNFCETKNTHILPNSKVKHLSYLGDAKIDENVNIGCGTITANYDGKNKHLTTIGKNVFVGCNSTLIAPLLIDENSFIAGGSVINEDVPKNTLAFGRARQTNIIGRAKNS